MKPLGRDCERLELIYFKHLLDMHHETQRISKNPADQRREYKSPFVSVCCLQLGTLSSLRLPGSCHRHADILTRSVHTS